MDQNPNLVSPSSPYQKKWYKKWWVIMILSILFFLLVFLTAFGFQVYSQVRQLKKEAAIEQLEKMYPVVNVSPDDDPSSGSPGAKVTIIAFEDFECPYCQEAYPVGKEIISTYGNQIYFVYRDFPLSDIHTNAEKAHEAAECANELGAFWPMHDKIYQNQEKITIPDLKKYAEEIGLDYDFFSSCLDSGKYEMEIRKDLTDGLAAGVTGTPTWFINGRRIPGVIPLETFKKIIDYYLKGK